MPVVNIDDLISEYELAEAKLVGILEDSCVEEDVHQADKELSMAFSTLLEAELSSGEMRLARIEFLLKRFISEEEPGSLNNKLRDIILADIAALTPGQASALSGDYDGLSRL